MAETIGEKAMEVQQLLCPEIDWEFLLLESHCGEPGSVVALTLCQYRRIFAFVESIEWLYKQYP